MKAIGIIPARYGSSRFPGKPLAKILDKSLVQHTYENTLLCKRLEKVVVATDDERIYDHVRAFGGEVVMTSSHWTNGTERIHEVIQNPEYDSYEIVVNVQGDEPTVDPEIIANLVALLEGDPLAKVATPITKIHKKEEALHPSCVKCVKDQHNNALYFSRSMIPGNLEGVFNEDYPYYRHLGIYAYLRTFLPIYATLPSSPLQIAENLEQLKVLENGYRIKVSVVDYRGFDVNHPEDIEKIERYLCKNLSS